MPHSSYDPGLPTDKDWVRFLTGDKDITPGTVRLEDAEIEALLAAEQSNGKSGGQSSQVYLAAGRAIEQYFTSWQMSRTGITETQIGGIRIKRADGQAAADAISARVQELRARGASLLSPRPRAFRVL